MTRMRDEKFFKISTNELMKIGIAPHHQSLAGDDGIMSRATEEKSRNSTNELKDLPISPRDQALTAR